MCSSDLLEELATRAPGRSVEVRVPPFAAVQCIPGPVHRRGTPPSVVETDAATWLALALGDLTWAQASESGAVRASGSGPTWPHGSRSRARGMPFRLAPRAVTAGP